MFDRIRTALVALAFSIVTSATTPVLGAQASGSGDIVFRHVPVALQRTGPLGLLYWQWLALPLVAIVAWLLGAGLASISRSILSRLAHRTETTWDDELLLRWTGPLRLLWATLVGFAVLPWAGLSEPGSKALNGVLRALLLLAVFWAAMRALTVAAEVMGRSSWGVGRGASRSLIPLGTRVGKVAVVVIAFVAMLAEFGYPVASILAGLGIGGLAFALAAQKTIENLFGAVSIGVDQPFREGDVVKVEDFVGTVEAIGLRSTRIRTLDRTMISIPNGKLAEMRLETYAARDRIRLALTVGVAPKTTESQLREILEGMAGVLRGHANVIADSVVVRFSAFGASSLDIEVMAWFDTQNFDLFADYRQEVLLGFMAVVERAGSSLALPTRALHFLNAPEPELSAPRAR